MGFLFSIMLAVISTVSAQSSMVLEWSAGGPPSQAAYANPSEVLLKVHPTSGPLFHYLNAIDPNGRALFESANCFKLVDRRSVTDAWGEHHEVVEIYNKGCEQKPGRADLVTILRVRNGQLFSIPKSAGQKEIQIGSISSTLGGDHLFDLCANHLNTKSFCSVDMDGALHIKAILPARF